MDVVPELKRERPQLLLLDLCPGRVPDGRLGGLPNGGEGGGRITSLDERESAVDEIDSGYFVNGELLDRVDERVDCNGILLLISRGCKVEKCSDSRLVSVSSGECRKRSLTASSSPR